MTLETMKENDQYVLIGKEVLQILDFKMGRRKEVVEEPEAFFLNFPVLACEKLR